MVLSKSLENQGILVNYCKAFSQSHAIQPSFIHHLLTPYYVLSWEAFLGDSDGKESACNAGDPGSIPGWDRFPGEGNGNPLQYPCLENPMDKGAWQATVHGVAQSDTIDQLSTPPKILISGNANDSLCRGFYS